MACTGGAIQYKIENSNGDDLDDEYDWLTLAGSQLEIDPSMVNVVHKYSRLSKSSHTLGALK